MEIITSYNTESNYLWLKGNLHTHTKNSACGHYPIEDVVALYSDRIMKYDFLAITDHIMLTDVSEVQDKFDIIIFNGVEYKKETYQTLGININSYDDDCFNMDNHQQIFDKVNCCGGINIICHPHIYNDDYWPLKKLLKLKGYCIIEIYNNNVKMNNAGRAIASDIWDDLLSHNRKVYGIASDDFHHYSRCGGGFVMVQTKMKTAAAILNAIRNGAFYSSSGIFLKDITVEGNKIHIASASSKTLEMVFRFISKKGVLLAEYIGKEAIYSVKGNEGYIRAEAFREDGAKAWTQPFWINP